MQSKKTEIFIIIFIVKLKIPVSFRNIKSEISLKNFNICNIINIKRFLSILTNYFKGNGLQVTHLQHEHIVQLSYTLSFPQIVQCSFCYKHKIKQKTREWYTIKQHKHAFTRVYRLQTKTLGTKQNAFQ